MSNIKTIRSLPPQDKPVSYLSKQNVSYETADIEEGCGGGGPPLVGADEVELGDQRVDELLRVVAPAVLAVNLGPTGVGLGGPGPSVLLVPEWSTLIGRDTVL